MAKKAAKHGSKTAPSTSRDAVGWGFWLLSFAVLYGPSWYLGYRSIYESERGGLVPWVIALTLAAIGAGLLSFAVNHTLRSRAEAAKKQARHKTKK